MTRCWLLAAALALGVAWGQTSLEQMRDLLQRGYYSSAARVAGPALVEELPDSAAAHLLFSRALFLSGDLRGARRELEAARSLGADVSSPEFGHLAGLLRAAEGDADGALGRLRGAFEGSGLFSHAMDWGRIAWQAGRFEEALEAYAAAAETEEGARSPWPHLNRGRILTYMERYDEAIAAYRRAIEVFEAFDTGDGRPSPAYVEAYFRLGEIYERRAEAGEAQRNLQLAEDNYRAALTGDPNYAPAVAALDALQRRLP